MRLTLCETATRETRPDHNTGNSIPYSLPISVWSVSSPVLTLKMQETGLTAFSPRPRRFERLTICRCNYKGGHILRSYFKTLSVGPV